MSAPDNVTCGVWRKVHKQMDVVMGTCVELLLVPCLTCQAQSGKYSVKCLRAKFKDRGERDWDTKAILF